MAVSIGVAARRAGVSAAQLRRWDALGLLVPARSAGGYRLYSDADVEQAGRLAKDTTAANRLGVFPDQAVAPQRPAHRALPPDAAFETRSSEVLTGETDVRRVRILRRLAHTLTSTEQEHLMLDAALDSALALVDADVGALSYADVHTQRYVLAGRRGLSEAYARGIDTWRLHEGLAGQAYGLREPITVVDLDASTHPARAIVREEGLRGYVCVPLLRGARRLGILEVFAREPRRFDITEVELLELIAGWIGPVVDGMLLAREVQALRDERAGALRDWTSQTIAAVDAERAATVDLLQTEISRLAGAHSNTSSSDELARLEAVLRAVNEAHRGWVDLVPLVRHQVVDALSQRTGKAVELVVTEWPASLPLELVSRLYLIVHGLADVAARASRTRVLVALTGDDGVVRVEVLDDRDAAADVDVLAGVTPDLLGAARTMGAVLSTARHPSGLPGVRVEVPADRVGGGRGSLTWREREVVAALATGATNRTIAAELGISPKTLQNHLTGIYRKLGVASRAQAVRALT